MAVALLGPGLGSEKQNHTTHTTYCDSDDTRSVALKAGTTPNLQNCVFLPACPLAARLPTCQTTIAINHPKCDMLGAS